MDVNCRKCGEPVDMDYFHDVAQEMRTTYGKVRADFARKGCPAIGGTCNPEGDMERAIVSGALFELLGDDIDGVAGMLEDWDYMRG